MKKSYFLLAFSLLFTNILTAQNDNESEIRLSLYGMYTFEDSFDSYYDFGNYYQGVIQDGMLYGLGFEFEVRKDIFFELSYLREITSAPTQYYNGGIILKNADIDLKVNYLMIGGNHSFSKSGSKVEGFAGFSLGMAVVDLDYNDGNPNNYINDRVTRFAWGLKAGGIIWATPKFGVKLQAQLLSVAQTVGGGYYFGTGGAGAGVSTYSSIYQFSLGGGLVYSVGK
jgi:hypothetical protein